VFNKLIPDNSSPTTSTVWHEIEMCDDPAFKCTMKSPVQPKLNQTTKEKEKSQIRHPGQFNNAYTSKPSIIKLIDTSKLV
jgi:hypothetical protein